LKKGTEPVNELFFQPYTAGPAGPAPGAAACGCEEEPAARNLGTTPIGAGTKSVASKNSKLAAKGE